MNNIVSRLKNIWQYIANNPSADPALKERFAALATKAKGMLVPEKKLQTRVSPRQKVIDTLKNNMIKSDRLKAYREWRVKDANSWWTPWSATALFLRREGKEDWPDYIEKYKKQWDDAFKRLQDMWEAKTDIPDYSKEALTNF